MQTLYAKFPSIFEEIDETSSAGMEEMIERNKQRRYRQGYSQFLTELLKQGIVEPAAFTTTVNMIITQMRTVSTQEGKTNVMEEYMNCLSRILKALAEKTPETDAMRATLLPVLAEELTPLTAMAAGRPSLTNRIRIGIMNALDTLKKLGGRR
jgi:tRNA G37 N-methylase Trm5